MKTKRDVNLSPARSAICHVALFTKGPVHCKPSRQCPSPCGGKDGGVHAWYCHLSPCIYWHIVDSLRCSCLPQWQASQVTPGLAS
jgi:hypothetical protein